MTPSDPGLHLSATYLSPERTDGAVQDDWAAARACSAAGLDALVDRQQLGWTDATGQNAAVRITRRAGVFSEVETMPMEAVFSKAITRRFASDMVASAYETGKLVAANPLADGAVWCDTSICGGAVVFLRLQGGAEPFYLVPHNFAVGALYFPRAWRRCHDPVVHTRAGHSSRAARPVRSKNV